MSDTKTENAHTLDLLSDVSRRTRKYLLAISGLSICAVKIDLIPTRISALGIELESADQASLLLALCVLVAYFCLAFIVYAWSDFVFTRIKISEFYDNNRAFFTQQLANPSRRINTESDRLFNDNGDRARYWNGKAYWAYIFRAVFEYLLPIAAAVAATYTLLGAVS